MHVYLIHADAAPSLGLLGSLSVLDRWLAPIVLLAMILGIIIGEYAPNVDKSFNGAKFADTSVRQLLPTFIPVGFLLIEWIAIAVGMIVMMWPALTKVQYEKLPAMVTTRALWEQIVASLVLNWIVGPLVRNLRFIR